MKNTEIIKLLKQYTPSNEAEEENRNRIIEFIETNDSVFGKSNSRGHLTGSAWIVNSDKSKVLLTNHIKLNMWIQLGGHTEEREDIFMTAYREGVEESGLDLKILSNKIFDIDVHLVPARQNEPAHYHYDIRFIFEADEKAPLTVTTETRELKWISIDEIKKYSYEESIYRMVRKTKYLY